MLVLTRKADEELIIGDGIRLKVVGIHGKKVLLGVTAPPEMPIRREELYPEPEDFGLPAASKAES